MRLPLGLCTLRVWPSQALHFPGPTPAGHGSVLNLICSRQLGPSCTLEAHPEDYPLALLPLPTSWALPAALLSQSGFRRREEAGSGPVAFTCFPGRPLLPCIGQPSLFRFPIATAADLSSQSSLSPPRGRLAPLPLPEPGAGALEARPGPAALAPGGTSA